MGEHFCILFLFRRYHLQIVLYMKLSVLKSIFGYIHLLTSPKIQSFPLLGRIRDFHPLATCTARRTLKKDAAHISAHSAKARIPIFLTQTSHMIVSHVRSLGSLHIKVERIFQTMPQLIFITQVKWGTVCQSISFR